MAMAEIQVLMSMDLLPAIFPSWEKTIVYWISILSLVESEYVHLMQK